MIPQNVLLFALLTVASLPAQKQASTLEALTRRASVVLDITVSSVRKSGDRLLVEFVAAKALRGNLTVPSELTEPLRHHCGGACHGLEHGQELILFADVVRGRLVPRGGSRGLVHAGEPVRAAVRALLETKGAAARLHLVIAQLRHASPRVREDAALALPLMRGLEEADSRTRARLADALDGALAEPSPTMFGLLMATARATPARAAAASWKLFLDGRRPRMHGLASRVLLDQLERKVMVDALPLAAVREPDQCKRTARLLARTASAEARPALARLAADARSDVREEALIGLLKLGSDARVLAAQHGATPVRQAAARLASRRARPSRFRAIRPRGTR